jgi:hypothetical protein
MNVQPFNATAKTISITAGTTATAAQALPGQGNVIRVVNESTTIDGYFLVTSGSTLCALPATTAASATQATIVKAGADNVFSIPSDAVYNISTITRTGSAVLTVSVGEGI